jgi:hypothetical protein
LKTAGAVQGAGWRIAGTGHIFARRFGCGRRIVSSANPQI